jgi:hypothetical protein
VNKYLIQLEKLIVARRKSIAAFVTPLILAQIARLFPSLPLPDSSMVEQLIGAAFVALAVHTIPNTPNPPA